MGLSLGVNTLAIDETRADTQLVGSKAESLTGGGLGHAEATPDLTKRRGRLMRRTRQGDFHILLYEASKAIGEDVDAYVGSLVSSDGIAGKPAEGKLK